TRDQALSATPAKIEEVSKELPNTGATRDASLVALGLLGLMSGYGLLAGKKRED
ncbi:TPA: LPXTG cell wall anchor domain-containing protein, partial [Streptococcus pneumoniae]